MSHTEDPHDSHPPFRIGPDEARHAATGGDGPKGVAWTPFDPGDAPELPASVDGAGRVVAMVASTELVGAGWAVSVASELARVWASQRPGVVLVDTDLGRPRLHHAARVDNAVGLAEVLRGEAPVADATRVVDEDRLFCVPAGNAPEDPSQGFDPTRWARLCKAFSDAGVTVAAYVPVQALWIDKVLETATDVVLLTEQGRRLEWPSREGAPPLRAVLGPMPLKRPPTDPTGKGGGSSSPLLGFDAPAGPRDSDDGAPGGDVREAVNTSVVGSATAARVGARRRQRTEARRHSGRRRMMVGAALLLAAMAAWAVSRPDNDVDGDPPGAAADTGATTVSAGGDTGTPSARPVPPGANFSVGVASYSDAPRAEERARRMAVAFPALPWMVAPVAVDGTVYHRVVGGLVADSTSARTLGTELARGGVADWVVRGSGWVVELGAPGTSGEAEALVAAAREVGIPAYLAVIQLTDGSRRFAAYAGAYGDPSEGGYVLDRARDAGFNARVTARMGQPPS